MYSFSRFNVFYSKNLTDRMNSRCILMNKNSWLGWYKQVRMKNTLNYYMLKEILFYFEKYERIECPIRTSRIEYRKLSKKRVSMCARNVKIANWRKFKFWFNLEIHFILSKKNGSQIDHLRSLWEAKWSFLGFDSCRMIWER